MYFNCMNKYITHSSRMIKHICIAKSLFQVEYLNILIGDVVQRYIRINLQRINLL